MKAPPFRYIRPRTLDELFDLLEAYGDDARVLAGGQSLLATLNLRLSAPAVLLDIGGLPLSGIREVAAGVEIGALTTHREVEHSGLVATRLPLLAMAMPHVAHVAIRNRGTMGGSLALADPAAEWPALVVALKADIVLQGRSGRRSVPADAFFLACTRRRCSLARSWWPCVLTPHRQAPATTSTNWPAAMATMRPPASPRWLPPTRQPGGWSSSELASRPCGSTWSPLKVICRAGSAMWSTRSEDR